MRTLVVKSVAIELGIMKIRRVQTLIQVLTLISHHLVFTMKSFMQKLKISKSSTITSRFWLPVLTMNKVTISFLINRLNKIINTKLNLKKNTIENNIILIFLGKTSCNKVTNF